MQTSARSLSGEESLSEWELSVRWGQPLSTIHSWRFNGKVPASFKCGYTTRFLLSEVEKFEEQQNLAAAKV
jgi:hypothetical protein